MLGNLCHWTDFILQMVAPEDRFPVIINPSRAHKSDCDIAVNYVFADGSIAVITFSAKGHTFEGVRERFAAHPGNALISMDDFQALTIEVSDRKHRYRSIFRDHGHEVNICNSYNMAKSGETPGCSAQYVWETGQFFLRTKEALELNRENHLVPWSGLTSIMKQIVQSYRSGKMSFEEVPLPAGPPTGRSLCGTSSLFDIRRHPKK